MGIPDETLGDTYGADSSGFCNSPLTLSQF